MRSKLFISFSVAVVAILVLIMVMLNAFISSRYRQRILYSASQSYDQAYAFLQNYVDSMIYASDLIYYNGDLQRVMTDQEFHGGRDEAIQYREFLVLDQVFVSAEMSENIYQTKVYVPDEIRYANHTLHFAGMSKLEAREDYGAFLEQSQRYFTAPEEIQVSGRVQPLSVVSLLRMINSTDGRGVPIAVEQVSILTSDIQSVIEKADITSTGLVYLINAEGEIISATSSGLDRLEELRQTGALPPHGAAVSWESRRLAGQGYQVNSQSLHNVDWSLVALVPEREIREQNRQIGTIILLLSFLAVVTVFAVSYSLAKYYTRRLARLAEMIRTVQKGSLEVEQEDPEEDEIGELSRTFVYMTKRLDDLLEEQYRTGKAVKSAQFQALQAQINPHFLYNTLDLINWEALDHDAPEIAEIAQSLARFYRISLNKGRQIVSIGEELRHVEAYVTIENRHFEGAIALTVDVPEEIRKLACINIILQPFVENAIMHNLAKDFAVQECHIHISAGREGEAVLIRVEDDGVGMSEQQLEEIFTVNSPRFSSGYGVKNINTRIQLCYGESYGLTYRSAAGAGVTVEIRIPALSLEEAEKRMEL